MTTLIIDSDHITFRCSASCEPNKTKLERDPLDAALWRIDACIEDIYKACEPAHVEMYIGGEDNFRKTLYPQYKANRAVAYRYNNTSKLVQYRFIRISDSVPRTT